MVDKLVAKADVLQLFRYPGLSDSAVKTLLRRVRVWFVYTETHVSMIDRSASPPPQITPWWLSLTPQATPLSPNTHRPSPRLRTLSRPSMQRCATTSASARSSTPRRPPPWHGEALRLRTVQCTSPRKPCNQGIRGDSEGSPRHPGHCLGGLHSQ